MKFFSRSTLTSLLLLLASACGDDAGADSATDLDAEQPTSGGICDGVVPCTFAMITFNGTGLPYLDLPREDWENPEQVTSGELSLKDFDGNGDGTWSMRQVWVEKRPSGDLEQFTQLAGDFVTEAAGTLRFTVLGGEPFTGTIDGTTVTLTGYPFSTKNATVSAEIAFRR